MLARARFILLILLLSSPLPTGRANAAAPSRRPTGRERFLEARAGGFFPSHVEAPSRIASPAKAASIASTFSSCGSWATLSANSPAFTRDHHMMIYDPVRDRLLIFGGFSGAAGAVTNEVWALSLASPALTQVVTSGTPPTPRELGSAIYDPVRDRMVVFGGNQSSGGPRRRGGGPWLRGASPACRRTATAT